MYLGKVFSLGKIGTILLILFYFINPIASFNFNVGKTNKIPLSKLSEVYDILARPVRGRLNESFSFNTSHIFKTQENYAQNIYDYRLVARPRITQCNSHSKESKLFLLVILISKASYFERRSTIRKIWKQHCSKHSNISFVFSIGSTQNARINQRVLLESYIHGDILLHDHPDLYYMFTHKVMSSIKFAVLECSFEFLMKLDDDIVVDLIELIKYLDRFQGRYDNLYMGDYSGDYPLINRDPTSRFYVSNREFAGKYALPYQGGSAYILSSDVASRVYHLSKYVYWPPFSDFLEDCYLGMLCVHLRCEFVNMKPYFSIKNKLFETVYTNSNSTLKPIFLGTGKRRHNYQLIDQWANKRQT